MKRLFLISILILLVLAVGLYYALPKIMLSTITNYEPYTFEKVLGSSKLRSHYGIRDASTPRDYGFQSEEIDFRSLDGTRLNSWYIGAKKPSNRCLLLIHGRTSNRLKTMKYLALVDSLDLDTLYNVFIPDLRNSGRSEDAKTYMGYKFAEDVIASIKLMKHEYQQDTILIYAFSMGAMATLNATGRDELSTMLSTDGLVIDKLILDSPLVNVKETLRSQSKNIPLAPFVFDDIFDLYSQEINGFGESMKMSRLLNPNVPTLILQSKDDELTLLPILEKELSDMKSVSNIKVTYFEGPGHVRIFQDKRTRHEYMHAVKDFLSTSTALLVKNK